MRYEDQRLLLVQDLKKRGIKDISVLEAFARVPRENYVLPEYKEYSYQNRPLPLNFSQTISQPQMIAIMLEKLQLKADDRVLEIGTGSGYQTALLAEIAKEVCTVELLEALSLGAQKLLKAAGYKNIFYRIGDGWQGWEKAYPPYREFDKIIVSAAADKLPEKLCGQLADGGILAVPVGGTFGQTLTVIHRENENFDIKQDIPCSFVPLVYTNGR